MHSKRSRKSKRNSPRMKKLDSKLSRMRKMQHFYFSSQRKPRRNSVSKMKMKPR